MSRGCLVGCVLLGQVLATIGRVPDWRSDETLWAAAVRVAPQSPRATGNYGSTLQASGHRAAGCVWLNRAGIVAAHRGDAWALRIIDANRLWIRIFDTPCD